VNNLSREEEVAPERPQEPPESLMILPRKHPRRK